MLSFLFILDQVTLLELGLLRLYSFHDAILAFLLLQHQTVEALFAIDFPLFDLLLQSSDTLFALDLPTLEILLQPLSTSFILLLY